MLKKTEGNWINNSKEEQIVVLPLYCRYNDESLEKIPEIKQAYYLNWKKVKVTYLSPITSMIFQPIYDHSIKGN